MKIVTVGNFKGGTGKTTNACMIAYSLSKMGYKTLLLDLDPQANATTLLLKTRQIQKNEVHSFKSTLMNELVEGDICNIITDINDNLYLVPSFADFSSYPLFLEKKFPESQKDRIFFLKNQLESIKNEFDFIIIDTPPTLSIFTDSAIVSSNAILIVTQTQERSFIGCQAFIHYLQEIYDTYDIDFDILGILPVLLKNTSPVDKKILSNIISEFGAENVFNNPVKNMERLKRYDLIGITDPDINENFDMHDKKVLRFYSTVTEEFINRIESLGD